MSEANPSNIQWGKVIAGAAIAAGAVAAFAFFAVPIESSVVPALENAMQAAGGAVVAGWNWIGDNVIGSVSVAAQEFTKTVTTDAAGKVLSETTTPEIAGKAGSAIVGFITKNVGLAMAAAAVAGGLIASRSGSTQVPEKASFAMEEQINRANALMQARMIANGYQPAMALAKGPGRG